MTDQEDNIFLGKNILDDKSMRRVVGFSGPTASSSLIVYLTLFISILLIQFGGLGKTHLRKFVTNQLFYCDFV